MPTTVNSDLIIYDDLAQTAFLERRQDNLEVFNAASNGAIILDNELIEGDFRKRTFYKVGGSIESRNVNSTDLLRCSLCIPRPISTLLIRLSTTKFTKKLAWWFMADSLARWVNRCW